MTSAIFDETLSLDQIVYVIEGDKIIESTIRALDGYIDETTTPKGIGPRLFVEGSTLYTWGHQGNFRESLFEFASPKEAEAALDRCHARDFWDCPDFDAYATRDDAEASLAQD